MFKIEKDKKFDGKIAIFPCNESFFDSEMSKHAAELILSTAESLESPTKLNIGKKIGIHRNRVARLILSLNILDQYEKIRSRKIGR